MKDWLKTLFRSRYVLWLEDEVERLRTENRSMMNSLLTRAGVQPIDVPKPIPRGPRRLTRNQFQVRLEREALLKTFNPLYSNGSPEQPKTE